MAETAITEGAVPVANWTLKKLWQELGYMCCYKSNIGDLNEQVRLLHDKRAEIKLEEETAREDSKIINGQVIDWLAKADEQLKEKETTFSEEAVAAKAACCNGWLPNMKGRFYLARNAKKMTLAVDQLLTKDIGIIAHPAPHPEVEFQPTEDPNQLETNFHEGASSSGTSNDEQPPASERKNIFFDSRRSTVGEVMEALRGNQINPIIICGMGGIGKTTLMGQVLEKAKKEGLFDEYTKATVKESLNKAADVIQIQAELAEYLGTKLLEDVKESGPRASKLRERLSKGSKKILVMLDNVSTTTPDFLWDIGIPLSCQILVTSRQQDLFMDMDTRKNFPIHGLPAGDAWSLFKKTAGSSIESDPELHVQAEKVLKECGGLPIAISTVGTALKGQSIGIWTNALRELEKACPENVPGVIEHVYGKIKFSYECLPNEQAKSCLLLCCIFEECSDILIEDLVIYGHGLGLLRGIDSILEGRNRVETLVHTLKSRFLLLESNNKETVKMHDVVRDVAIHIASEEFVEKKSDGVEKRIVVRDKAATVKLMDWPQDSDSEKSTYCSSLSISGFCQLLLLRQITRFPMEPPPTIFKRTEDLMVLTISGYDRWTTLTLSVDSVLPSLAVMRNLQTLRVERCGFNCDVSVIGELKTLMILSLRGCRRLEQLPDTFKNLSDLRLLDLTDCYKLEVISPGVISSLTRLEELYMLDGFKNWEVEKLASTETTEWISQLEEAEQERAAAGSQDAETTLYTWKGLNELAVVQPAEVGKQFREEVQKPRKQNEDHTRWANSMDWNTGILAELLSLSRLTTLEVALPPLNILLTTPLFNKLERFKISIGWKEYSGLTYEEIEEEQSGNYLRVHHLDVSNAAMGSGVTSLLEKASYVEFKLTQPQLLNVLDRVCFPKTKRLKFQECNDVEYLIDTTTTTHSSSAIFPVLNSLEISKARRLKVIFHGELPTGFLKQLRALILFNLPALTYIWKTNSRSQYDNEEVINFQSLTKLDLSDLPSFTSITKYASKGTDRLPEDSSPEQSDITILSLFDTKVHFPVLTELRLGSMNFKEIWNNQLSAESFCELRILRVERCHELLHLVPTHMQNRLQKLEYIEAWRCSSLKEIFEFRRLIVDDEGDATTISESGDQGAQINKMMSFKQSRQAFQNLRDMSIWRCESLRTLLSPSVARGLVKLQTLKIEKCRKIEEIVAAPTEGEETEDDNMFPQLCTLELMVLPNLRSFSQGKYNFRWPLVKDITILHCYNMKMFCLGSLSTPKGVKIDVQCAGESVLQELNDSRQEI
ncbi:PREDICTED: disease resistance protein At4g27190-like isoform X1 [Fragaria vesca subsp. vesca]|uniref:disease resistance protein At4g27190-like isoform X1 n=1 Tax=Fragaria vesca subsp. vesca TaxID=101020 RepID=UPI0002C2E0BA|nr:PREDICTED: disease resistance protein At4g27190-like isoform X1 [Fragaria vesca subsp. vesca]